MHLAMQIGGHGIVNVERAGAARGRPDAATMTALCGRAPIGSRPARVQSRRESRRESSPDASLCQGCQARNGAGRAAAEPAEGLQDFGQGGRRRRAVAMVADSTRTTRVVARRMFSIARNR